MDDLYIYLIVALLPLSSLMLMIEVNPYHALVIRGILGAVAVLAYVVLGAADVALTEALMGTMLAVSLYIIAIRSSLVMRLGIIKSLPTQTDDFTTLVTNVKKAINDVYLRLEVVAYDSQEALEKALEEKEIHGICSTYNCADDQNFKYEVTLRIERIYQLLKPNKRRSFSPLNTLAVRAIIFTLDSLVDSIFLIILMP